MTVPPKKKQFTPELRAEYLARAFAHATDGDPAWRRHDKNERDSKGRPVHVFWHVGTRQTLSVTEHGDGEYFIRKQGAGTHLAISPPARS